MTLEEDEPSRAEPRYLQRSEDTGKERTDRRGFARTKQEVRSGGKFVEAGGGR